jgi:opacity protein-like surface antigen
MKHQLYQLLPLALTVCLVGAAYSNNQNYYVYADQGAAAPAVQSANDFNGLFVGLSSGINIPKNYDETNTMSLPTPIQVPLQISAGYSHVWDTFYAGGQINFGWNFVPSKTGYLTANGKDLDFNNKWQTMATVQVGGVISNTSVIYGEVGGAFGSFNYASSGGSLGFHQGGFVAGAGVSMQLTDHLNFDMNYRYIYYAKKTGIKNLGDVRANQNMVTAGLSLHFL